MLVERADACGCSAIVLTVDNLVGNREPMSEATRASTTNSQSGIVTVPGNATGAGCHPRPSDVSLVRGPSGPIPRGAGLLHRRSSA
jgi:isopentenyl diphosphate isomerase/L-lactate dehydrogenase-like FMN-dependent dehydrogenase